MLKNKYSQFSMIIFTFLILACVSDVFLIRTHILFNANDMLFHIKRIYELYSGNYFSSFAFNYFHGSAVMGMYPFISILPLVFILHITSSYVHAYFYFFILITFISLIVAFFSSLKFSRSKRVSYLFAIIYSLSIAYLVDYFHDGDLGITTSLIFLPMVIFGILDLLKGSNNYIKLSLGLAFMTFCQLPSTIIITVFLLVLVLININRINKSMFYNLIRSITLVVLLTAIVWIPFLKIILFNKISTPTSYQIKSSNIISIVKNVGIIPFLSAFIVLFCLSRIDRYIKQMYFLSIIIIIASSNYMPLIRFASSLKFLHFINTFQFTARFLIIPQIILCYFSSWVIMKFLFNLQKLNINFIGVVVLIILLQFSVQIFVVHQEFDQHYQYANSYQSVKIDRNYIIKNSWMKYLRNGYVSNTDYYPTTSISKHRYINNNEAIYDNNNIIHINHIGYNEFSFNNMKNISNLILPILHYNGEHLHVYLNHHLVHYHVNKNNLITLNDVKKNYDNMLIIRYIPNVWLMILKFILFLFGVIWIIWISIKNYTKKNYTLFG